VPRYRHPPLAAALCASVLLATFVPVSDRAAAQTTTSSLFRPQFDGDPTQLPRFRRASGAEKAFADYSYQPGRGAGTTGFDSTNAKKKKGRDNKASKAKPKPSTFGAPPALPAPKTAVPRAPIGIERRGATPYLIAPSPYDPPPDDGQPKRRRRLPDETPFDPIGIQVGAFNFKPALEVTTGYDTNPARSNEPIPSWYSVVAPELKFGSNWGRHEFTGDLRGSYSTYYSLHSQDRPNFDGKLTGRVDVTRDTRIDLETKFLIGTDNPGSPNIPADLKRLPIFLTWGGTAGIGHRFNRLDVSLKGGAERTVYQQSTFENGATQSNDDRNYNRFFTTLRNSYEVTPGLKPFAEVGIDRRVHDLELDLNGLRRDSDGLYVKGGSTFELTRIITGELAVGWLTRRYEDPRLPGIAGPTVDGSLVWVASALTTVKLTAKTTVEESTLIGVSGSFSREVALQVDHAFRRWLIATASIKFGIDDYVGLDRKDNRYAVSAAIVYKLTRDLHLKSELRHDWLRSSEAGADYNATAILFGLRLQR
jgi:hypothetical protein